MNDIYKTLDNGFNYAATNCVGGLVIGDLIREVLILLRLPERRDIDLY